MCTLINVKSQLVINLKGHAGQCFMLQLPAMIM